jgi:hypothetical protein
MTIRPNTSNEPENLRSLQMSFAAHIRDPGKHAAPEDVEDRRMAIYRRLFFNNIVRFLASNFPVLRQLYDEKSWRELAQEFYTEHRCHTPLFPELPKEFLRYLQEQRTDRAGDPAFMLELAHYEWVELALSMDENELEDTEANREGDLMAGAPVLSPLAWPLSYRFPVHQIRPGYEPDAPPEKETHLLVYRNRNYKVKFMQLNDVSRLLLALLQENSELTGLELLTKIASRINHPDPSVVIGNGKNLLQDLRSKDILLGTRPA